MSLEVEGIFVNFKCISLLLGEQSPIKLFITGTIVLLLQRRNVV